MLTTVPIYDALPRVNRRPAALLLRRFARQVARDRVMADEEHITALLTRSRRNALVQARRKLG
jgi:hypothetical protein